MDCKLERSHHLIFCSTFSFDYSLYAIVMMRRTNLCLFDQTLLSSFTRVPLYALKRFTRSWLNPDGSFGNSIFLNLALTESRVVYCGFVIKVNDLSRIASIFSLRLILYPSYRMLKAWKVFSRNVVQVVILHKFPAQRGKYISKLNKMILNDSLFVSTRRNRNRFFTQSTVIAFDENT